MLLLATILIVFAAVQSLVVVAFMFRVAGGAPPRYADDQTPGLEAMRPFVLWRSFYVNPADPRGWVPKTSGIGWTVNFRTRERALVFAAMIASALLAALVGACLLVFGTG